MPTVYREGPYRFFVYPLEDEPPHVHVERDHYEAKFWLDPVGVARHGGFPAHEINKIGRIVVEQREHLLAKWYEHAF